MPGTRPALGAVLAGLSVLPWTAQGCPWPLFTDVKGSGISDTSVRTQALPRAGGALAEECRTGGCDSAGHHLCAPTPCNGPATSCPICHRLAKGSDHLNNLEITVEHFRKIETRDVGDRIQEN